MSSSEVTFSKLKNTFQAFLDISVDPAAVVDDNGIFLLWNKQFEKLLDVETLEGANCYEFTHPEDIDIDRRLHLECISKERSHYTIRKRYITANNKVLFVRLTVRYVCGEHECFSIAVATDVSKEHEIEEIAQFRQRLLNAIEQENFVLHYQPIIALKDFPLLNLKHGEPFAHEALITEGEYQQIFKRLQINSDMSGRNKGKTPSAIPPIVVCDSCNRKMSGRKNGKYGRLYRCGKIDCSNGKHSVKSSDIELSIQKELIIRAEEIANATLTDKEIVRDSNLIDLEEQLKSTRQLYAKTGRESFKLSIEEIEAEIRQIKSATSHEEVTLINKRALVESLRRPDFISGIRDDVSRRYLYMDLVFQVRCLGTKVIRVILKF